MSEDVTVELVCLQFPEGTKPLTHQVAGHIFGRSNGIKKANMGFLQNDKGNIFKAVQGPVKGQREVEFYKKMFSSECRESELITLRTLVPKYDGIFLTDEFPNAYLRLEDLTAKFQYPCVMDVKIGPVTYDMNADAEKIKREKAKFPDLHKVGFQLVGIKVYDPKTKEYKIIDRTYLRALNEHTILTEGLRPFFNCNEKGSYCLITSFLKRLRNVERWFLSQKKYIFIASSLLFVYDGVAFIDAPQSCNTNSNNVNSKYFSASVPNNSFFNNESFLIPSTFDKEASLDSRSEESYYENITDLRMIDFTHVFLSPCDSFDDNYLIGLKNLIEYLQRLRGCSGML